MSVAERSTALAGILTEVDVQSALRLCQLGCLHGCTRGEPDRLCTPPGEPEKAAEVCHALSRPLSLQPFTGCNNLMNAWHAGTVWGPVFRAERGHVGDPHSLWAWGLPGVCPVRHHLPGLCAAELRRPCRRHPAGMPLARHTCGTVVLGQPAGAGATGNKAMLQCAVSASAIGAFAKPRKVGSGVLQRCRSRCQQPQHYAMGGCSMNLI